MSRRIEAYRAFNDPLNNKLEQYHLIKQLLDQNIITIEDAIAIVSGRDLIQEQFDKDLKKILEEDDG